MKMEMESSYKKDDKSKTVGEGEDTNEDNVAENFSCPVCDYQSKV